MRKIFVLIFAILFIFVNCSFALSKNSISTPSYIVYDRLNDFIIKGKNENKKVPMASTTKIMTAIIALENGNIDDVVTVSKNAQNTTGWQLNLKKGDEIALRDLLYAILLYSANDGAIAVAEHISGSVEKFCNIMNDKAKELGLSNTNFTSPHGLDNVNHYSTPYDMAVIMDYALNNEMFRKILGTQEYTLNINGYSRTINNTNRNLNESNYCRGGKTGYTGNAMYCLACNYLKDDKDLVVVTLGSNSSNTRFNDNLTLFKDVINNYMLVNSETILKPYIDYYFDKCWNEIKAIPKNNKLFWINKLDEYKLKVEYIDKTDIIFPINRGESLCEAVICLDNDIMCKIDYICFKRYEKMHFVDYYIYMLYNYLNLLKFN